jgi:hypothetical protein
MPRRDAPETGTADVVGYAMATVLYAVGSYLLIDRRAFASLLGVGGAALGGDERWLVPLGIMGNTLVFLLPALVVASALSMSGRRRTAFACFAGLGGLGAGILSVDLRAYADFGRHLTEVLRFASLEGGGRAAGGIGQWLWPSLEHVAVSTVAVALAAYVCRYALARPVRRASRSFRGALGVLSLTGVLAGAGGPVLLAGGYEHSVLVERLFAALPVDLRPTRSHVQHFTDPVLDRLSVSLSRSYKREFPRLLAQHPVGSTTHIPVAHRPNLIVIVLESLRADALSHTWMPRLTAWADGGLRLSDHYAGSNYSEAGLFALLYGRSPLVYHAALDNKVKPDALVLLERAGYHTGYFSGHPVVWMRREEFINRHTFDSFVHYDKGPWIDWDRHAMSSLVKAANAPHKRPLFGVVFLISSHFEYRYPEKYERHLPVINNVHFSVTHMSSLGAAARVPLTNRYHNSLAFLDDLVADAIDKLDPDKNVIVLTGDHGESLFDDGRYGHGYSFADVIAKTPMAIVGPGVPRRRDSDPTLHVDVLPTLAHLVAGQHVELPDAAGRDLLQPSPPRNSLLLAHASFDHHRADALLVSGSDRLRLTLGLYKPTVTLRGFEDRFGHVLRDQSRSAADAEHLVRDFSGQLLIAGGHPAR